MKSEFLSAIILLVFCSGCQYDPFADDLLTERPRTKDIIGTYVFEKQTITHELPTRQTKSAKIILRADSTFKATDIPSFFGPSHRYNSNVSASGAWHIATNGGVADGSGGTKAIWGIKLSDLPDDLQYIEFLGEKPPYKLIVTYGDPDEGVVMIFRKLL